MTLQLKAIDSTNVPPRPTMQESARRKPDKIEPDKLETDEKIEPYNKMEPGDKIEPGNKIEPEKIEQDNSNQMTK